jgi:phosphatidate cytidylyltransferase
MSKNLILRIASAAVLVPIILALLFQANYTVFASFISMIGALAGFEYSAIVLGRKGFLSRFYFALLSGLVAASVAFFPVFHYGPLIILGLIPVAGPMAFMFDTNNNDKSSRNAAFLSAGTLYCGGLVGFIGLVFASPDNGRFWVLTLLAGTFMGDTAAYAFGKLFGRHKLAPRLSPGKTWEGSLGGVVGTTAAVAICKFFFLPELDWIEVPLLSAPLSLFCQVGDLAESMLKRAFGVKDSGKIIPGHGGLLDRIDALLFGAPVVFLFTLLT